ncbi:translation initiation factor IF-2-like [Harpia harpyja]|uniref:translation initiation factor IF-2-like n=1 Tax=Harpia harpyja TaxID=202280 RepID=UPI0022B08A37|nr:translation initiation factor IF-2-like [Harpia harpyja]
MATPKWGWGHGAGFGDRPPARIGPRPQWAPAPCPAPSHPRRPPRPAPPRPAPRRGGSRLRHPVGGAVGTRGVGWVGGGLWAAAAVRGGGRPRPRGTFRGFDPPRRPIEKIPRRRRRRRLRSAAYGPGPGPGQRWAGGAGMRAAGGPPAATHLPPAQPPAGAPGSPPAERCPGGNRATPGRLNLYPTSAALFRQKARLPGNPSPSNSSSLNRER